MRITHLCDEHDLGRLDGILDSVGSPAEPGNADDCFNTIYLQDDVRLPERYKDAPNLKTFSIKGLSKLGAALALRRLLKEGQTDIVHAHSAMSVVLGKGVLRFSRLKGVVTVYEKYHRKIPSSAWRAYAKIIAVSEYIKEDLVSFQKINGAGIEVVHDGLDVSCNERYKLSLEEKQKARASLGLKADSRILGCVGPLVREQDQATAIKALSKLVKREENVELVLFGDGPLKEDLLTLAAEYGVAGYLKVFPDYPEYGPVPDMIDILIISAYVEQNPRLILRAMLAGKPVIATQIGAHGEYIEQRKTGYLVPCGFPERIESSVKMLLAIDGLIEQTGAAAKKRVEDFFNIRKAHSFYKELYSGLLK